MRKWELEEELEKAKKALRKSGWVRFSYMGWEHLGNEDTYVLAERKRAEEAIKEVIKDRDEAEAALIALAKHLGIYDNYLTTEQGNFKSLCADEERSSANQHSGRHHICYESYYREFFASKRAGNDPRFDIEQLKKDLKVVQPERVEASKRLTPKKQTQRKS